MCWSVWGRAAVINPPVKTEAAIFAHRQPDTGPEADCDPDQGCITCGDIARPLRVLELDRDRGLALCRDGRDRRETVEIGLVLPVDAGDVLLVHAGTAIGHLTREQGGAEGRS